MKRLGIVLMAALVVLCGSAVSGCGASAQRVLNVYNWGDYIGEDIVSDFMKKYPDIKVNYEMYETNEDMYSKLENGNASYDILVPSDYMIERLIREDKLEKLDFANIPNYQYIGDRFRNLPFDPNNEYSVPYMWGTVGILYNKKAYGGADMSWGVLWDGKYRKRIFMMDSIRDTLGVTLKYLGYSLNTTNEAELNQARDKLVEQGPLVLAYTGDEVKDKMIAGEADFAVVWSGDAVYCMKLNPDLGFAIPREGSNIFFDSVVIPKGCRNKKDAELFINFLCDPEIGCRNADYIGYSSPNTESVKLLPEDIRNSPIAYPTQDMVANCEPFKDLGDDVKLYDRAWTEIKAQLR